MAKRRVELKYDHDVYVLCKTRFGELTDPNRVGNYTPRGAIVIISRELMMSPSSVAHCVAKKIEPNVNLIASKLDALIASESRDTQLTLF